MSEIKNLQPQIVWRNFYALTQVPRPSGHLEKVQQFLLDWAAERGIEAFKDNGENIVMRKPATAGMENRKTVVMQAHMDMVPQKLVDSNHNFETDPIETYIDGDWVKAKGTTLGADNGLGMAAIMAALEDDTLVHGPIEALFTSDEETCMYGVNHLAADTLTGDILLNIDNETMGEFVVGSAGGVNVTATMEYKPVETAPEDIALKVTVAGLRGGHSGLEICENRANANKLVARFLQMAIRDYEARLVSWHGGNMRNAIPRESSAVITIPEELLEEVNELVAECKEVFTDEYYGVEHALEMTLEQVEVSELQVPEDIQDNIVDAVLACHDGVLRNIPSMPHIVETSSNLAIVNVSPTAAEVLILARSSSETMMDYVTTMLESCFNMAGMKVEYSGRYGAWQPNFDSQITAKMVEVYKQLFNEDAIVQVVHAGLECSLIGEVYPKMDLVSFGPTMRSPHTPDERCNIPSVDKFWIFLKELLGQVPVKD
ncbi:MAG: aminoacyl-histidine dipeptidase [Paraprevotella sp.]|jgi:dipeptidase D|nr:aminoacyl-histidine dipeptidase [Paraprevotella sp.]MBR0362053.1 aminoacyl-histidine dipeptidase [Paraprevotella sp.]